MTLEELIMGGRAGSQASETSNMLPEAKVMELREVCKRYAQPCLFKVGDLVTPRKGAMVRGEGEPQIVLEVFEHPVRGALETDGSWENFSKYDMRVGTVNVHGVSPHMVESWMYEPYTGEGA